MKHKKLLLLMLPLMALLVLSGCKTDSSTDPTSASSSPTAGQPTPTFEEDPNYGGALATIMYEMASPIPGFPAVQANLGFAMFGKGVDGGAVTVNGTNIGRLTQGSMTYYILPNPQSPLVQLTSVSFNGSNHNFAVAGNGDIPAFSGSVKSPSDFSYTSPTANSTVAKANGIKVTWVGGSSNKVLVQIVSVSSSSNLKVYQNLTDNGSYTIPAADIASFSGDCLVYVVKYNYSSVSAGSKKYYLISEIVKSVTIKVN